MNNFKKTYNLNVTPYNLFLIKKYFENIGNKVLFSSNMDVTFETSVSVEKKVDYFIEKIQQSNKSIFCKCKLLWMVLTMRKQ